MAANMADIESIVEGRIFEARIQRQRLSEYINGIDDACMRMIMKLRHIDCRSWSYIAHCIGGNNTPDAVRKAHDRFLLKK